MSQMIDLDQEWLKVLGKGMVTLPKKWREELRIKEGDVVKAKKEGNKVVIEAQQKSSVPYRIYTSEEIKSFLKDDQLPKSLKHKLDENLL